MALTVGASAAAKVISIAVPLIVVRLAMDYLGAERYGLWMTVTSLVGMLGFSDLGLGNGLMVVLSKARGKEDNVRVRRAVSSTLVVLLAISIIVLAVFLLSYPFVQWGRLVNATTTSLSQDAAAGILAVMIGFAVHLPLGIVERVQAGLQEGYRGQLWRIVASLLTVPLVFVLVAQDVSFGGFVFWMTMATPSVLLLNGLYYFVWQHPELTPRRRDWSAVTALEMLQHGKWFFILNIVNIVGLRIDNVIVAHAAGLSNVAGFSVTVRIFSMLSAVAMMFYQPMWAANGEALARGEAEWVRRNTWRMAVLVTCLVGACGVCLLAVAPTVFRIWLGPGIEPEFGLIAGLTIWSGLLAWAGPWFMVINGAGVVRPQVCAAVIFTCLSLPFKYIAVRRFGVCAVPWTAAVFYALVMLPFAMRAASKVLREIDNGRKPPAPSPR